MEVNFNSNEYAWTNIIAVLLEHEVTGPRGVEHKVKSQMEALFVSGRKARGMQRGKKEYEGTVTLLQSEPIALGRAAREEGYEDILDTSFDAIVSYVPASGVVATDKIIGVSFTEIPRGMKGGDLKVEVASPFIALGVVSNVL